MTLGTIAVEVVYALPERQTLLTLQVPAGATVRETIEQSGVLQLHPEIDLSQTTVGIHGRRSPLDAHVREHDRVEIYRPLTADPKDARRRRARA